MKTEIIEVQGFSGPEYISMPCKGEKIEFDRPANHGDWKTASVRRDEYKTIPKGTKCKVVGWMQNYEGVHVKVKHNGSVYDIPRHQIVGLR